MTSNGPNGYSDLEISQKRSALEKVMIPETLASHKKRLKTAGFTSSETLVPVLQFCLSGRDEMKFYDSLYPQLAAMGQERWAEQLQTTLSEELLPRTLTAIMAGWLERSAVAAGDSAVPNYAARTI